MDRLWAPWRDTYVTALPDKRADGCIFCDKPREDRDRENYIVYRAERVYVILNAYPYNNGHVMVIPYAHVGDLTELDPATAGEIMTAGQLCVRVLEALHPDGFNLGMNLGRPAGAGVADHLHLHVVPRWAGDTNFMTVVGETRVLSQSLDRSYETLRRGFEALIAEGVATESRSRRDREADQ